MNCVTRYTVLERLICRCSGWPSRDDEKGSIKSSPTAKAFFYAENSHSAFISYFPDLPNLIRDSRSFEDKRALLLGLFARFNQPDCVRVGGVREGKGLLNVNTLNRWAIVPFYTRLRFSIFYAIRYEFWLGRFFFWV